MVGEGREKFGHVFLADTGTSNGDITGQTRPLNTVDLKVKEKWNAPLPASECMSLNTVDL